VTILARVSIITLKTRLLSNFSENDIIYTFLNFFLRVKYVLMTIFIKFGIRPLIILSIYFWNNYL